jgi:hypothetical protein
LDLIPRAHLRDVPVSLILVGALSLAISKLMADGTDKWGKVIRAANIKPE